MFATDIDIADLRTSLTQAVATGRVGLVVSARLHWQIPFEASLEEAALISSELIDDVLRLTSTRWRIRRSDRGGLLHVMGTDDRGRTIVVTINHGPTADAQLTLFGNHGVLRLDRAELRWPDRACSCDSAILNSLQTALSSAH